jgi:cytochrome c peroxidase
MHCKSIWRRVALVTAIVALCAAAVPPVVASDSPVGPESGFAWSDEVLQRQAEAIFPAIPERVPGAREDSAGMIALGKRLYHEPALSVNRNQTCNTCHPIDGLRAGADNRRTSAGTLGRSGDRNDPTVYNVGLQMWQFWDGRAGNLQEQAASTILNPLEMAMPDRGEVVRRLQEEKKYRSEFRRIFPGHEAPLRFANVTRALASFQRSLLTTGRFQAYLRGDREALSELEKEGLHLFLNKGCVRCHNGAGLGGTLLQKVGVHHPYRNRKDLGRFEVTGREEDKFVFKVPMLQNVTLTSPYFHDGAVGTLGEAVETMARLQLDQAWSQDEIHNVLRFLSSLADTDRTLHREEAGGSLSTWNPPDLAVVPDTEAGDLIRYGYELLKHTNKHLGSGAPEDAGRYSGNSLECRSCHQEVGTKRFGVPWMGVSRIYPRYRSRPDSVVSLQDRINGCFRRSMNGRALPEDSREMKAIVACMKWLSRAAPQDLQGIRRPGLDIPERRADLERGGVVYEVMCQSCHGSDGQGYPGRSFEQTHVYLVPPLWGPQSYTNGAGTHRVLTAASFVKGNMPLGTRWDRPMITDGQAFDVAAYINSFDRPKLSGLEKDWPDLMQKPIDCPYPPYADGFSREQHKYGPFQPIMQWYAERREKKGSKE